MYMYIRTIAHCCYMYMYNYTVQIRCKVKARVIYTCLHEEANCTCTEANTCTCLYIVKWVYTRRQTRLHEKANMFALYFASDLYCMLHVYTCMYNVFLVCVCVLQRSLGRPCWNISSTCGGSGPPRLRDCWSASRPSPQQTWRRF